jgi:NodT family efflux transporter outer membrane factor (OMF) lipoprotein
MTRIAGHNRALVIGLVIGVGVSSCAAGPNYSRPAPPTFERYSADSVSIVRSSGDQVQRIRPGADIPGEWWALFHSSKLNALVEECLRNNAGLAAAQAALRMANENAEAQNGALFPQISGSLNSSKQYDGPGISTSPISTNYGVMTPEVTVSYALDVFGGARRQSESLAAQAELERYQLDAAYVTLTSKVVLATVREASLRAKIDATVRIISIDGQMLDLIEKRDREGEVSGSEIAHQEVVLAQARAQLPPLEKELAQQRDLLATLAGRQPGEQDFPIFTFDDLTLPRDLPLSLPSQLVDQRPDVRAAEANVHIASAGVGVAVAKRLPQFSISATAGSSASQIASLLTPSTAFWELVGSAAQPIFDAGALYHRQAAAEQAYVQAKAEYRSAVVNAVQNVADVLHAIDTDGRALSATAAAERAATRSTSLVFMQMRLGAAATPLYLLAQQNQLQAAIGHIDARANQYSDTVALFQALGGGWRRRADVKPVEGHAGSFSIL